MAYVPVQGWQMPPYPTIGYPPAFGTGLVIDATGEKIAMMGTVWNKDRATKNITRVGFRFGTVTKAGGSALTVSLQDINLAAGPTIQPDETQDQTVAIANANAAFVSNTWIRTDALSAARSVAFGAPLAVVIEYDGAGRLGADTVMVSSLGISVSGHRNLISGPALKSGTWSAITATNDIILEFDDGTFGTLLDAVPANVITVTTYGNGSAADELALEFTVPAPIKVDGAWIGSFINSGADLDIVLYNGTTVMATFSVDSNAILAAATQHLLRIPFATEQELLPGNTYRLSQKPTTAATVAVYDITVADANHFQASPLDIAACLATRVDAGAWTTLPTRRPLMGLYVSAIPDGAGGGSIAHVVG